MCALQSINPYHFSPMNYYGKKFNQSYNLAFRAQDKFESSKKSPYATERERERYEKEFKRYFNQADNMLQLARNEEKKIADNANYNLRLPQKLDYYA